jgi:hemolysin secretion/activation protein ShlB/FhaC/HecB
MARALGASWLGVVTLVASVAEAQNAPARRSAPAQEPPEAVYPVGAIHLEYAYSVEGVPDLASLSGIRVPLVKRDNAFAAPGKGVMNTEPVPIDRPEGTPVAPFTASAIQAIDQAIAQEFTRQGIIGVVVRPHPQDIGPSSGRDLRPPERTALRLVILVSRLVEQHTIATGPYVADDERVDNPEYARIVENSPAQIGEILHKSELEDYIARLNRQPGRWVDMTVGASAEPAGTKLEYRVAEGRPWTAYVQASNTGTENGSSWRERFGFTHTQLTGRDDILSLEYITGDFSDVNAFYGSYDSPIPFPWLRPDRLRGSVDGQWSDYHASDVGFEDSDFKGSQWTAGGRLTANVYQYHDFFADLFTGAHYQHFDANSHVVEDFGEKGDVDFFFPEVGAVLERRTEISRVFGSVSGAFNVADIAGTDRRALAGADGNGAPLGRTGVHDPDVNLLRWEAGTSFFMVPFFFPAKEPDAALPATALSNEVFLSFRGQYTEQRLIPALEEVVGGLETVRGYRQSFISGDRVYLARAEYRVHVPRLLSPRDPFELPGYGPFRVAPDSVTGRPDWDLILRAFYDWGRVELEDEKNSDEARTSTLSGAGVGMELQLPGDFIFRFDYGLALTRVTTSGTTTDKFDDQLYFSLAFVY